jgi:hypothetical protein
MRRSVGAVPRCAPTTRAVDKVRRAGADRPPGYSARLALSEPKRRDSAHSNGFAISDARPLFATRLQCGVNRRFGLSGDDAILALPPPGSGT